MSKEEKSKFDKKRPPMKLLSALARRADSERCTQSPASSATALSRLANFEKEDNPMENKSSADLTSSVECFTSQPVESPHLDRRPTKPTRPPPVPPIKSGVNGSPAKSSPKTSPAKMSFKVDSD